MSNPLCTNSIHNSNPTIAVVRLEQHGCWTGYVCASCLDHARLYFATRQPPFECGKCGDEFDGFDAVFTKAVPL